MGYNVPMKRLGILVLFLWLGVAAVPAQRPHAIKTIDQVPGISESRLRKHQHEEIKKLTDELITLAFEVEEDIDKSGENVLPLSTLKKLEEIEKLAKKIRDRLKQ